MKGKQLPAHGGIWIAEFDVVLDATKQRWVIVLAKSITIKSTEPS